MCMKYIQKMSKCSCHHFILQNQSLSLEPQYIVLYCYIIIMLSETLLFPVRSMLELYGEVYFRAWRVATGNFLTVSDTNQYKKNATVAIFMMCASDYLYLDFSSYLLHWFKTTILHITSPAAIQGRVPFIENFGCSIYRKLRSIVCRI